MPVTRYENGWSPWGEWAYPIYCGDDIMEAAELIRHLYEDLREYTGGPLHIVLEDGNVEDHDVEWCGRPGAYDYLFDGSSRRYAPPGSDDTSREQDIVRTCNRIIELFMQWPEAFRVAAIAWAHGDAEAEIRKHAVRLAPPEVVAEEWRAQMEELKGMLARQTERARNLETETQKLREDNYRLRALVDAELRGAAVDLCLCGKSGHQHAGAPFAFCIWCCPQCNQFQPKVTS